MGVGHHRVGRILAGSNDQPRAKSAVRDYQGVRGHCVVSVASCQLPVASFQFPVFRTREPANRGGGARRRRLSPAHEVDDLDVVAVVDERTGLPIALDDGQVVLDRNAARIDRELFQ